MRIGILGSGLMGGKLGTLFARAGHEVVFSYARSEQKLKRLAREAQGNARAGSPGEAARKADALLLAVHWSRVDDVLKQAGDVSGKVIVSCSLPMNADDTALVIAHTSSGAERGAVWCVRGSAQNQETQPRLLRRRCQEQKDCRYADPRRGVRSCRRWALTDRPVQRAVHAARGPARV